MKKNVVFLLQCEFFSLMTNCAALKKLAFLCASKKISKMVRPSRAPETGKEIPDNLFNRILIEYYERNRPFFNFSAKNFQHFMKHFPTAPACFVAVFVVQSLFGGTVQDSTHTMSIGLDKTGAMTDKQFWSLNLPVTPSSEGAQLRCDVQRLIGRVTPAGLWLNSSSDSKGKPFRVVAESIKRGSDNVLPSCGSVQICKNAARLVRPGLTEEYTVSVNGIQQDFMIERRPEGKGELRLGLKIDGAQLEPIPDGARLVLADPARAIVYNGLKAQDALGKDVKARMEVISGNCISIVLDDEGAEYPIRVDPTFSDANWINPVGLGGTDGDVIAIAMDGTGNIYIGGGFTVVGNVAATNIAKWNGTSWAALGSGISGVGIDGIGPYVYTLAVLGTNLYVGGTFSKAGGMPAANIACWNGSSWSTLGLGTDKDVDALAVSGNTLYVGGGFVHAGGVVANYIAQWNGIAWSTLGSGIGSYSTVDALLVSGANLYAAGYFTAAGGVPASCIAQWNGNSWSALGSGMENFIYALAMCGTNLYAGGDFLNAGGVPANRIAQWNGTTWTALGAGTDGDVLALAVSGTNLYVGGGFDTADGMPANNIALWNGNAWSTLGSGLNSYVSALLISGNDLYVGGDFTSAGTNVSDYFAEGIIGSTTPSIISTNGLGFAGGQFGFIVDAAGDEGQMLTIQATTNLVDWVPLQTNMLGSAFFSFADSSSNFTQRFYRAQVQP